MTKFTREQISKARQLADFAFDMSKEDAKYHPGEPHPEVSWIDAFTEALGLDVEDEKPEPGTWHLTAEGLPAFVDNLGWLRYVRADGVHKLVRPDDDWPELTPARVIPEAERDALTAKVESQSASIEHLRQARDEWAEKAHKAELETKAVARRKMGTRLPPAEPVELSKVEVGELWDANRDSTQWSWTSRGPAMWRMVTATVNAALAKHGHGRVEVSRDDVLAVVEKWMTGTPWGVSRNEKITNAIMELLKASK